MDAIAQRFRELTWEYGDRDPNANAELATRIATAGRRRGLITYSELVQGVEFNLPNAHGGPRYIDTSEWEPLDRNIIGSFLGHLSMQSYERAGFFSSALGVGKRDGSPGEGFYNLLRDLGLIKGSKADKALHLWAEHVAKAHQWYVAHPTAAA